MLKVVKVEFIGELFPISPLNTRNVGTDGFEFYSLSPNMKVHYVAVGPRAF